MDVEFRDIGHISTRKFSENTCKIRLVEVATLNVSHVQHVQILQTYVPRFLQFGVPQLRIRS